MNGYFLSLLLGAAVAAGATYTVEEWRWTAKENAATVERQAQALTDEHENRRIETARTTNVIEATNAQAVRTKSLRVYAAGAVAAGNGLRDDLAAATAKLPSSSPDACRNYAAAVNSVLGELEAEGRGIAEKADGHASDTLTLEQAWPVK